MKFSKEDKAMIMLHIFVGACFLILCVGVRELILNKGFDNGTANLTFWGIFVGGMVLYFALLSIMPAPARAILNKFEKWAPARVKAKRAGAAKLARHQASLQIFDEYTALMLGGHLTLEELTLLNQYVRDYLTDKKPTRDIQPLHPTGLKTIDLYHYGWNMWNFFGTKQRNQASVWLQVTFAPLRDQDSESIYRKMRDSGSLPEIIPITEDIEGYLAKIKSTR